MPNSVRRTGTGSGYGVATAGIGGGSGGSSGGGGNVASEFQVYHPYHSQGLAAGGSALLDAINRSKVHLAKFILDAGELDIVNTRDFKGKTPLIRACYIKEEKTRSKAVQLLLSRGAEVNLSDDSGRTALSYACELRCNDVIPILIKNNVDPDIADNQGNTALIHASTVGNDVAIELIVRSFRRLGLNVDHRNSLGKTALLIAVEHGHIECASILASEGRADTTIRDPKSGQTAEQIALATTGCVLRRTLPQNASGFAGGRSDDSQIVSSDEGDDSDYTALCSGSAAGEFRSASAAERRGPDRESPQSRTKSGSRLFGRSNQRNSNSAKKAQDRGGGGFEDGKFLTTMIDAACRQLRRTSLPSIRVVFAENGSDENSGHRSRLLQTKSGAGETAAAAPTSTGNTASGSSVRGGTKICVANQVGIDAIRPEDISGRRREMQLPVNGRPRSAMASETIDEETSPVDDNDCAHVEQSRYWTSLTSTATSVVDRNYSPSAGSPNVFDDDGGDGAKRRLAVDERTDTQSTCRRSSSDSCDASVLPPATKSTPTCDVNDVTDDTDRSRILLSTCATKNG